MSADVIDIEAVRRLRDNLYLPHLVVPAILILASEREAEAARRYPGFLSVDDYPPDYFEMKGEIGAMMYCGAGDPVNDPNRYMYRLILSKRLVLPPISDFEPRLPDGAA